MKSLFGLSLLIICILFLGCNSGQYSRDDEYTEDSSTISPVVDPLPDINKLLLGTWESTIYITPETFAKSSNEEIPEGISMEITAEGTATYHLGNRYESESKMTLRITNATTNMEIPLRFYSKDAGTWKIFDETLVETTEEALFTPLDDITKSFIEKSPEFAASIQPIKGATTSTKIISINESTADMEELEQHLKFTMRKKL